MSTQTTAVKQTISTPPGEYTVTMTHSQAGWCRLGNYRTLEEAQKAIAKNEHDLKHPDTFGGLINWPKDTGGRRYAIWKATWDRVS